MIDLREISFIDGKKTKVYLIINIIKEISVQEPILNRELFQVMIIMMMIMVIMMIQDKFINQNLL